MRRICVLSAVLPWRHYLGGTISASTFATVGERRHSCHNHGVMVYASYGNNVHVACGTKFASTSRMRLLVSASILSCFIVLIASADNADACSLVNDRVDAPSIERAYDAAKSPAAPSVVEARIYHNHDDSDGCQNGSCGTFHSLSLTLDVDPNTMLIRIDFASRPTVYASVWDASGGTAHVVILGYEDANELALTIRAIDHDGYLSQGITAQVFSDDHDSGCSASGNQSSALLLLAAIALCLWRRRRAPAVE